LSRMDFSEHVAVESARFLDAIRLAAPDARVPSCPDWDADDLLWHLGQVQFFWGTVVLEKVARDEAEKLTPERPGDRDGLLAFYQQASDRLVGALTGADPAAYAWTWADYPDGHTVGFIQRRQAHEALIHRVDAELTAAQPITPLDPELAADGVDEGLRVMYGGCPSWGTITPQPERGTIRLRATDTGDSWLVTLARFTGTDPEGVAHDEPDIHIADSDSGEGASAEVAGRAGDLDCWLWHRAPLGPVERSGETELLSAFAAAID
jgi:uncharacterized protein (TIGR03083 family)